MRYAVSLPDLLYPERLSIAWMLIGPVRGKFVYPSGRRFEEVGVELACSEDQARAIIQVLGMKSRWIRFYQSKQTGWTRIPRRAALLNIDTSRIRENA